MTSQPGKQIIAMHIQLNICTVNQAIKFGHLVECNMRNIVLKKSHTKCGAEVFPESFLKSQN